MAKLRPKLGHLNKTSRMNMTITRVSMFLGTMALLSACSSIGFSNTFGSSNKEQSRTPYNATEYICDNNQHFYVRMLNNGKDVWLIYPTHEVNLTKSSDSAQRYTSGVIALDINGDTSTLNDGEKIAYTGCKAQIKK